jgi:hypothetical protein
MRKALKIVGLSLLLLILFRGAVFRAAIKYHEIGTRPTIRITNAGLIDRIEVELADQELTFDRILKVANEIARAELSFTTASASNNPNKLIDTQQANCIGYAAMFNSVIHYLIASHDLQGQIKAKHIIGRLELLGVDLHSFFDSPFFNDHDYNVIIDLNSGERVAIDPSVSDYLGIERVSEK